MTKQVLRKQFLQQRLALSLQEKHQLTAMMLEQFSGKIFPSIKIALGYLAIEEKNELSSHFFEEMLEINNPDLQVCYPAANAETLSMTVFAADDDLEIGTGPYNIPQPISGNIILPEMIDLIFVPLLAFDKKGFRVGYGKGYYDRFITRCKPTILTVGLSFFDAVETISDTNQFDIPLTHCITPNQVYVF
jgi:5-formyltetrahydrofolate cyclo-ligase